MIEENILLSDSSFEIAHFKGDEQINFIEQFVFNRSKHHLWSDYWNI